MTENRRISIKALLLGALTDIGGSLVVGSVFGLLIGIVLAVLGVPQNRMDAHLQGLAVLIPSLVIGFGFTVLGGFVAGRVSKSYEVMHGGIVGCIGIVFGLFFWASLPLWYNIASLLGVVPCGMLGGRIAATTRHKT